MTEHETLYYTKSVCSDCLKPLTAAIMADSDGIYMEKSCPEHGVEKTLIWADSKENYLLWLKYGGLDPETLPQTPQAADSALSGSEFCGSAGCQPVTSALMTTNRCNMDCPVCFTRDKKEPVFEPSLADCRALLEIYREKAGADALLEFCGGEPTVRPDILQLASLARDMGFDFIQLNTNGIALAKSLDFCRKLKESGITTVYLGLDGISENPYLAKYGKPMLEIKKKAVENCAAVGLAVVLVTCVIPGENDSELGGIIEYAKEHMPAVRGVFLQPISYFGIYPKDSVRRITIPDVIRRLASQSEYIKAEDFSPAPYEHPQCSFQACYMQDRHGNLKPLTRFSPSRPADGAYSRVRASVRATWLPSDKKILTVGGMAFQDSSNIDLLRLRRCSVQIIGKDGALLPLCGKYLSGCDGRRALPGIS